MVALAFKPASNIFQKSPSIFELMRLFDKNPRI